MEFFGEDAEGVFGDDEVDFFDAGVGDEGAKHLGGVDGAAGAGDGEGEVARDAESFADTLDYR